MPASKAISQEGVLPPARQVVSVRPYVSRDFTAPRARSRSG
jgi:hypothetical protein